MPLTDRQRLYCDLVAEGLSAAEIAVKHQISYAHQSRWREDPEIQAAVKAATQAIIISYMPRAARVLGEQANEGSGMVQQQAAKAIMTWGNVTGEDDDKTISIILPGDSVALGVPDSGFGGADASDGSSDSDD